MNKGWPLQPCKDASPCPIVTLLIHFTGPRERPVCRVADLMAWGGLHTEELWELGPGPLPEVSASLFGVSFT